MIINFNNTGLDWTYAGPIAPNEFGAGNIEPASYRASEGWRFATQDEWALKPAWQDFTRVGFAVPPALSGFTDHSVYRFTSQYWSTFDHVDLGDAAGGRITNGSDIGSLTGVWDTWYVRDTVGIVATPEAGSSLLLLGAATGALCAFRRKS